MARNMIKYSQYFFDKIIGSVDVPTKNKMYIASEGSSEEIAYAKEDFKNLKITSEINYLFGSIKVFDFTINENSYFAMTNIENILPLNLNDELEECKINQAEINTGIFLALTKDADLEITSTLSSDELEELYLFQQEEKDYAGHTLKDIKKCIVPLSIFQIAKDSVFYERNSLEKAYFIISFLDKYIHLPISILLPKYREIFLKEIAQFPYENIFLSMTATHWKHSFLEVYRCIERLFVLPRTIELKNELKLSEPAMKIARQCFLQLGWKSKEEDALRKLLLNNCKKSLINELKISSITLFKDYGFEYDGENLMHSAADKLAEKIYKVRNSFVHQFHTEDELSLSLNSEELEILTLFLLEFTSIIYNNYIDEL